MKVLTTTPLLALGLLLAPVGADTLSRHEIETLVQQMVDNAAATKEAPLTRYEGRSLSSNISALIEVSSVDELRHYNACNAGLATTAQRRQRLADCEKCCHLTSRILDGTGIHPIAYVERYDDSDHHGRDRLGRRGGRKTPDFRDEPRRDYREEPRRDFYEPPRRQPAYDLGYEFVEVTLDDGCRYRVIGWQLYQISGSRPYETVAACPSFDLTWDACGWVAVSGRTERRVLHSVTVPTCR